MARGIGLGPRVVKKMTAIPETMVDVSGEEAARAGIPGVPMMNQALTAVGTTIAEVTLAR